LHNLTKTHIHSTLFFPLFPFILLVEDVFVGNFFGLRKENKNVIGTKHINNDLLFYLF
jgi:hypothetical protein